MAPLAFRAPRIQDAASIWRMAPQRGTSEQDSCYMFILLCAHFADTSIVAEVAGAPRGYALGYRIPTRPLELFVCRLGVAADEDPHELTPRLFEELLARRACADARFLCLTCNPRDLSLQERCHQFARRRGVRYTLEPCFPGSLFSEARLDENLLRLGPLVS